MTTPETFSKLSATAQYDDMVRTLVNLVEESFNDKQDQELRIEKLQKCYEERENQHRGELRSLKTKLISLEKEITRINQQLIDAKSALVRETEEKRCIVREKRALREQIQQVRKLVEKESFADTDAHRNVMKCLERGGRDDQRPLTPIQSDDSDDCVYDLDYDRTEDDLDPDAPPTKSSRRSAYDDAMNDQPTLPLYRYLDKNSDNNENQYLTEEPRRSSRLAVKRRSNIISSSDPPTSATTSSNSNPLDKYPDLNIETTDTNTYDTDDNDIEYVRQQLKKYEAENKDKLVGTYSTPNLKDQKRGATLCAKSTASLMKSISNINTPVANALRPHSFQTKKVFKPETCGPCNGRIGFYNDSKKCEVCGVVCHPECEGKCPLPCVKITAPNTRSKQRRILISDYVNADAVPKVPALIVHCCNVIEREENITQRGLYVTAASTREIEDLMQKIVKSKSGMPNLNKFDVHLLAGVVKRFLQSLDETLITTTLWGKFAEAVENKSHHDDEARIHMKYLIKRDMPSANRDTLSFLMQHFHTITKRLNDNDMSLTALAKALAPTIIGNSCRNPPTLTIENENKTQYRIMSTLFSIEEDFWNEFVQKMPTSSETPQATASLGSRLLAETPTGNHSKRSRGSRLGGTLPTPKLKPLFQ